MISVIISARNAERELAATLGSLVPAAVDGLVKQVIVVDCGSTDGTALVADHAGADVFAPIPGHGEPFVQGAAETRFPWLLFLDAGTVLEDGWETDAISFMREVDRGERPLAAGAFLFRLNEKGLGSRVREKLVRARSRVFGLEDVGQGVLMPRKLFNAIVAEQNADVARALDPRRLIFLDAQASAPAKSGRWAQSASPSFAEHRRGWLSGFGFRFGRAFSR
jgi:glycosyltransferase involved in cell wall biosynthesis